MKNNKSLGQHWLNNRAILEQIADLTIDNNNNYNTSNKASGSKDHRHSSASQIADTPPINICLEIGPGLGTLTSSLLKRFKKVIAVEYDARLAANLPKSFPGKNLEVIHADILRFDFTSIQGDYVIAGNIPYYITSPILERVLTTAHPAYRIVLLIQKEVAERILSEKESVLSLFVKNRASAYSGPVVLKGEFTPPPKVDSKVLVLEPHAPYLDEKEFKLIRQGFRAPRKKLFHNLSGLQSQDGLTRVFASASISLDARPGDLHLDDWHRLYLALQ